MCGISGGIGIRISEMIDQQSHRGPDYSQSWCNNFLQLGHNRLSILDLSSAGNQPMESSRYVLTYNGEIYNYRELQSYLIRDDDMAIADGIGNDAATLLKYIEKFGIEKALSDINGMYAFGLYDKQERVIHLCVDRFGQKPLYYGKVNGNLAFASTPAALLHLRPQWSINYEALQSYWKLGSIMQDSIFDGIYKLNAAEHLVYKIDGGYHVSRYWEPQFQSNTSDIEDLILDSIRKVKVSDVPIYIFLSGGIDSTLVASQFKGGNAIHLFSKELKYAQRVAERFGINLISVTPAECDPIKAMNDFVSKSGEPTMAGLTPWIVSKEASKYCKVAISANGADELFFGYDRTTDHISASQISHIFRDCIDYNYSISSIDERLSSGRWLELMTYVQHDLNKTLDFGSMAHSLEVRSPFLDHRLVQAALSIPASRMGRKIILKEMLVQMGFDYSFINRPKMGFSLYTPVPGLQELQNLAYEWAINEGWLKLSGPVTKRDHIYLSACAYGFHRWLQVFRDKISF